MRKFAVMLLAFLFLFAALNMPIGLGEDEPFIPENETTAPEEAIEREPLPEELIVGTLTKVAGNFFTDMWGNNTSDIDVRNLLHGYSTVVWTTQTAFSINPIVIEEVRYQDFANGDKSYVLYIADNLTYNDGTPITAADFVFSILFAASPEAKAIGASTTGYRHIVGYEAYNSGETNLLEGLRLLDEYSFSIRVKAEALPFFYENSYFRCMPYPIGAIAPGCVVADDGDGAYLRNEDEEILDDLFTPETLTETIFNPDTGYMSHPYLTCGAYKLKDYNAADGTVVFEKNEHYIGNYEGVIPTIEKVTLKYASRDTMIGELAAGEYNLLNKLVDAEAINAGLALENIVAQNYARNGYGFISFACEQGPQQSKAVRQAIAYALDQTKYLQEFLGEYGLEVYGYYGVGQWMAQAAMGTIAHANLTDDEQKEWEKVTLEGLNTYAYDLDKAKALLVEDGWVLNAEGEAYTEGLRYRDFDGQLTPLSMKWAKTATNSRGNEILAEVLLPELEKIGFEVEVIEMPFAELLTHYYRQTERVYDMFFLATNFNDVFDPYTVYNAAEEYQGSVNTTGYSDEELTRLSKELRETEQGDLLSFYLRWYELQKHYNEVLPTIPIYSNIYMDLRTDVLLDYQPDRYPSWSNAIIYAHFGYPEDEEIDLGEGDEMLNIEG